MRPRGGIIDMGSPYWICGCGIRCLMSKTFCAVKSKSTVREPRKRKQNHTL